MLGANGSLEYKFALTSFSEFIHSSERYNPLTFENARMPAKKHVILIEDLPTLSGSNMSHLKDRFHSIIRGYCLSPFSKTPLVFVLSHVNVDEGQSWREANIDIGDIIPREILQGHFCYKLR
jgi:hypothetical protein